MYKVIFLDDELITLHMLESAINWQKYDIFPSGTATDGEEGIALFQQIQPDIIIADIRMPKMNGIEFARAIRQTKKPVKIVLLSAYAEFEYAQSALAYQISDYLLKPLDEDKLEAVIARIVQELERDTAVSSTIQNYRLERAEKYLQRLLVEYRENTELMTSTFAPADLIETIAQANTLLYFVRVAEPHELQIQMDFEGIRLFLKDRFGLHIPVVYISPVELVALCAEENLRWQLADVVIGLRLRSQPVKVGISRISEPLELLEAYRQAENALDAGFYSGQTVQFFRDEQAFLDQIAIKLADFEQPIIELVEQGRSSVLVERLQFHLFDLFSQHVKTRLIEALIYDVFNWIKIAVAKQYPGYTLAERGAVDTNRLRACATTEALVDFITFYLRSIGDALSTALTDDPGYYIVKSAKDYAREHYTEASLSLQDVADHVGLSKNHFSRVFHKTTGMKFWDYVTQLRIEKAKELLKQSNRSNYEICREIGYESEFYFSKIFKKVVGIAAQEFKRL